MGTVSQCSMISDTRTKYRISPTPHSPTATRASSADCDGHTLARVDAETETDCVPTAQRSQVPLTPPSTESWWRASSRLPGTP